MYGCNCVNVSQRRKQWPLLWTDHFLNIVFILYIVATWLVEGIWFIKICKPCKTNNSCINKNKNVEMVRPVILRLISLTTYYTNVHDINEILQ